MNRHNKTESAVFLYSRFSLFLEGLFFQIIYKLDKVSAARIFRSSSYSIQEKNALSLNAFKSGFW